MAMTADAQVRLSLVDRITGPINRLASRISGLSKKIGLDRVAASFGKVAGTFRGVADGVARSAGRLTSAFAVLGTSFGGIVAGAYGVAKSTADVGAALTESSFKLGIGVEALQEYQYAAMMSGIEGEKLEKGIEKLGINAAEAAKGNKTLRKEFKDLGVAVKGANGQMRPTEAILNDTLSALADIEDPIQRNRVAFKLFGKSGVDLVKMLGDGSDGLKDMRNEARRTGNVMSTAAAAFGDEFGDNVDRLLTRLQGLKKFLGVQLLPVMNELVESVTEWVDENQELIRSNISEFVKGLGKIIKDLLNPASELRQSIKELADGFASARDTIRPFVDFMGGPLKTALAVIGLWALAPAISALSLLAIAFGQLGLSIGGVAVKSIRGIYDAVTGVFDGVSQELESTGKTAGSKWGKAFGIAARAAMIAGVALATAELLQTFDPKGNLGGLTTSTDNWMRSKLGLPEKDTGITPAEIWQGTFGSGDDKPEEKKASAPVATKLSSVALDLGFANSPIFGDRPGKTKDDLGIGFKAAAPSVAFPTFTPGNQPKSVQATTVEAGTMTAGNVEMPDPIIAHEPQTIDARTTVSVSITGIPSSDAAAIAGAVKSALAERDRKQAAAIKSSLSD